jgi:hypothetical protein
MSDEVLAHEAAVEFLLGESASHESTGATRPGLPETEKWFKFSAMRNTALQGRPAPPQSDDLAAGTLDMLVRWKGDGGLVCFGNHSQDGLLPGVLDEDLKLVANVSLELSVPGWKANS